MVMDVSLLPQFYGVCYCSLAWKGSPVAPHPDVNLKRLFPVPLSGLESAVASAARQDSSPVLVLYGIASVATQVKRNQ